MEYFARFTIGEKYIPKIKTGITRIRTNECAKDEFLISMILPEGFERYKFLRTLT